MILFEFTKALEKVVKKIKKAVTEKDINNVSGVEVRVYDKGEDCYCDIKRVELENGDIIIEVE